MTTILFYGISAAFVLTLVLGFRSMMTDHLKDKHFRANCKPGDRCGIFDNAGDKVSYEILHVDRKGGRVLIKNIDDKTLRWALIENICAI